jgi:hypothetical protein
MFRIISEGCLKMVVGLNGGNNRIAITHRMWRKGKENSRNMAYNCLPAYNIARDG